MTEKFFKAVQNSLSTDGKITGSTESFSNPFMSNEMKLKSLTRKKKEEIMRYIEENESARTSEIAERFNLSYEDTHYILKQLENDNKIVIE